MNLANKQCVPCQVGAPTLKEDELQKYLAQVDKDWKLVEQKRIEREFEFVDFRVAIEFINKVAKIAESQGHHPNIYLYDYKKVRLELWTHKIGGLHENDFILASKIDEL